MSEHKAKEHKAAQVTSVTLSLGERHTLYQILLGIDGKGEHMELRKFNRAFDACGLDEFEKRAKGTKPGESLIQDGEDADEQCTFDLTGENVDFLLDAIKKVPLRGLGMRIVGPVVDRLRRIQDGEAQDVSAEMTDLPRLRRGRPLGSKNGAKVQAASEPSEDATT